MASTKRKINKGLIVLNKGERIAVISLLSMIVILLGFSIFRPMIKLSRKDTMAFHRLDSLLAVQDALLRQQEQQQSLQESKTPDNITYNKKQEPNEKTYYHNYTKTNPQQFQHKKPHKESHTASETTHHATQKVPLAPIDINQADSTELLALPQIGATMASRIHRYRNRLGGFVTLEQLFEIKGMDTARFETIKPYITININELQTINVNQDEFKTLLRHPYLEYEQVKAIVNHRERKGMITSWKQLRGIIGEVNPLLERYLVF